MRKCIAHVYVDSEGIERWTCREPLFLHSTSHKMDQEKCYHYKCPGRQEFPTGDDLIKAKVDTCKTKGCTKDVAQNKKRHCSESCRLKDNRSAYKQRMKEGTKPNTKKIKRKKICKKVGCNKPTAPNKLRHCSERCRLADNKIAYRARKKLKLGYANVQ